MERRLSRKMQSVSPSLTLAITAKAKAMKMEGKDVISFGVGEPDFNTPKHIVEAGKRALDEGKTKYTPSSGLPELRKVICEKLYKENGLSYTPEQVIVSNGAKHSVFNVCFALLDEGDEVIIPAPYWLTYPEAVRVCGGVPVFVHGAEENNYKITAEDLEKAVTERTKMLIFNSPCNPTGAVYTKEEIYAIARVCEIYEKICYDGQKAFSIANCSEKMYDLTITVNGVSKTYAMTGWRIGYLAAPKDVAKAIDSFQSHATSNACSISQYATIEALSSTEEEIENMVSVFDARRKIILDELEKLNGVSFAKPKGAFYVMLHVGKTYGKSYEGKKITDSLTFADLLLEAEKVAVVPGVSFGADDCVRLSYSLSEGEIVEGVRRIGRFLSQLV